MKYQIKSLSGHQSAKVMALLFILLTIPFSLFGIIGFFVVGPITTHDGAEVSFPWLLLTFAPIFYGGMNYAFGRFLIWAYNFTAKFAGGIEFFLQQQNDSEQGQ